MAHEAQVPEQGQIVKLRHKIWAVTSITTTKYNKRDQLNRIGLECLSDDALGHEIHVIWEREIVPTIIESTSLPLLGSSDDPEMFRAFIRALQWGSSSLAVGDLLQAPFRGGVQIEEYQLAPVIRASKMPRVRILLADDVGLGKTIEAGLITQELIHNHRATRTLVICPAHLKTKWCEEMAEKFGLEFRIIDRDSVLRMRKEYGPTINPWASFPRLVTSIDYLKTEHPRRLFDEFCRRSRDESPNHRPLDLLIFDEAHNAAPSGRKQYICDSERTSLMRAITDQFEHKLFLTATPHNGYRESFTGLLEILDNLRFSRGTDLDKEQLSAVTIRRLKEDIKNSDGTQRFPERVILPKDQGSNPELYVELSSPEKQIFQLLKRYSESRLNSADRKSERAIQFILTLLKKRALSSPLALRESLLVHIENAGINEELEVGESLFKTLQLRDEDDWSDDDQKEENLTAVMTSASKLIHELNDKEKSWLQQMYDIAETFVSEESIQEDSKAAALISWIEQHLRENNDWNGERVIIFTEYKHTLNYLQRVFEKRDYLDAVEIIVGGMNDKERDRVNKLFQLPNSQTDVRILIATDAASEGADFQKHCRNLIHYEIPWNPIRLEQRNGRIDRHGQRADQVRIHHFVYKDQEDSEFLKLIVEKVESIRNDLGSVSRLITNSVRNKSLGKSVNLSDVDDDTRREIAHQEMQITPREDEGISHMIEALHDARNSLDLTNEKQLDLLNQALFLEDCNDAITVIEDNQFYLTKLPTAWVECRAYLSSDGVKKPLSFDRSIAWDNDDIGIVHLDHPLMRRAIAAFRVQIWGEVSHTPITLNRVLITESNDINNIVVIPWGRLILLGAEHNRLHEGVINCQIEINQDSLTMIDNNIDIKRTASFINTQSLQDVINPHIDMITDMLIESGNTQANELIDILNERGELARKHAQSLATERIKAVRKAIKEWQTRSEDLQMALAFDDEEKEQRQQDLDALKTRLTQLEDEREFEPKRQKKLYSVADQRVYPVAIEIIIPKHLH